MLKFTYKFKDIPVYQRLFAYIAPLKNLVIISIVASAILAACNPAIAHVVNLSFNHYHLTIMMTSYSIYCL